jgi:hypothetical protein
VSVDFDPVPLGPRRRRVDPVTVGVIAIVVALAVAVVKPWDHQATAPVAPAPSVAVAAPIPSATRAPTPVPSVATPAPEWASVPSWAAVASAIAPHDAWGVRAITVDQRLHRLAAESSYHEHWSAADASIGAETATLGRLADPVTMLGVTSPREEAPRDVRIWRIHQFDQLEWIDAFPIAPEPSDASLLFIRPGRNGDTLTPWQPGQYRVEVLVADGIHRLWVLVPDASGVVPPPDTWTRDPPAIEAGASDPSVVRIGMFATVDGVGVSLPARQTRPLDDDAAWLDLSDGAKDVVATAYLPRASGLGVMLTSHAAVSSATIQRLAPGPFDAPEATGGISESQGRTPYVLFRAPAEKTWAPGVYAISVTWSDGAGAHEGTWHVELRPGVG